MMKKMFMLMVLLASQAAAYDVVRYNHHEISYDLADHYSFEEAYTNSSAWIAYKVLGKSFVQSRAPELEISSWSVERNQSKVIVRASGLLPDFAQERGGIIKVGGKGFIDKYCNNPYGVMRKKSQLVETDTALPHGFRVTSAPENYVIKTPHLLLNYTARLDNSTLHERTELSVLQDVPAAEYCAERRKVEKALTQGVLLQKENASAGASALLLAVLASALIMLTSLALITLIVMKRRQAG